MLTKHDDTVNKFMTPKRELPIVVKSKLLAQAHPKHLKRNLLIGGAAALCIVLVAIITLFTKLFFNQTGQSSSGPTIIANKTLPSSDAIDTTLWYGNYSGNSNRSLLTISKTDGVQFKFTITMTTGDVTDKLAGNASILTSNTARYEGNDGFVLFFSLSNGVVTINKDPYCPNKHSLTFVGDYVNIEGGIDCYSNHYFNTLRSFGSESVYKFDVNNDGVPDTITYKSGLLTINKQSYDFADDSANLDFDHFYMVDLDVTDGILNILVMDDGPSSDPTTTVISYHSDDEFFTSPLGCNVTDLSFDNHGTISGYFRFSLLQTWYGSCKWNYKDNQVSFLNQKYYTPIELYTLDQDPTSLNQPITIYKKDDLNSEKLTLNPQQVKFIKTDNESFVEVVGLKDKTDGWIYLKDYDLLPDENKYSEDVFDNLILAD